MTDTKYAVIIYCRVFKTATDAGDAYIGGILDAINALDIREQAALEGYYRLGHTYAQIGKTLGGYSGETARKITEKALLKLKHPSMLRKMSVKAIITQKDKLLKIAAEKNHELYMQIENMHRHGHNEYVNQVE